MGPGSPEQLGTTTPCSRVVCTPPVHGGHRGYFGGGSSPRRSLRLAPRPVPSVAGALRREHSQDIASGRDDRIVDNVLADFCGDELLGSRRSLHNSASIRDLELEGDVRDEVREARHELRHLHDLHTRELGRFVLELGELRKSQDLLQEALQRDGCAIEALRAEQSLLRSGMHALRQEAPRRSAQAPAAPALEQPSTGQRDDWKDVLREEASKCHDEIDILRNAQLSLFGEMRSQQTHVINGVLAEVGNDMAKLRQDLMERVGAVSNSCQVESLQRQLAMTRQEVSGFQVAAHPFGGARGRGCSKPKRHSEPVPQLDTSASMRWDPLLEGPSKSEAQSQPEAGAAGLRSPDEVFLSPPIERHLMHSALWAAPMPD